MTRPDGAVAVNDDEADVEVVLEPDLGAHICAGATIDEEDGAQLLSIAC
jgi:hypothetical protein